MMAARQAILTAVSLAAITHLGCAAASSTGSGSDAGGAAPDTRATPDGGVEGATTAPAVEAELERLLTGRFDSKDQAARDRTYLEIQLLICPVVAPELGPRVLYVEQARMDSLTKPYRQRLYVVERRDAETAVSRVFELRAPKDWIGACERAKPAATRADAEEKAGCAVELRRGPDGRFVGSTGDVAWNGREFEARPGGQRCPSELNGASYASSTVTLDELELVSWDRGYDASGKQVWGATAGGYHFTRR